jgi:hypothetical protein
MDRRWVHGRLFTDEYMKGVEEFMHFVRGKFSEDEEILCPCSICLNQIYLHQDNVERHILMNGMENTYTKWIHHGENLDIDVIEQPVDMHVSDDGAGHDGNIDAVHFDELLEGLHTVAVEEGRIDDDSFLTNLMKEAKRELYPGCTKFSKFSFVVKLLHMKSFYRISNTTFSSILKLLAEAFPALNTVPKSYDDAKKLLQRLGLGYDSIHVCLNNCVLFRKQYAELDHCSFCETSRWKDLERKRIPQKVLRHFPLAPRLQRMFVSKEAAEEAQWHRLKRRPKEKEMSHPADGEAWQAFNREYPDFANDARNSRLGLGTDGFNPFGNMNTKYSIWPVIVVPYNLPPWACMEESNFLMALLIPGPSSPSKDFDVFLEPLVKDLLELWKGIRTYDALSGKMFNLRAAVLWCIRDYPALATISSRTTKGFFACIHCDKNPLSYSLRNKIGYFGHCRFLPSGHHPRKCNEYTGLYDSNDPPESFSKEELQLELEKVRDIRPGTQQAPKKRKRSDLDQNEKKFGRGGSVCGTYGKTSS